jgi:methyl-accepting chemotaxis protein
MKIKSLSFKMQIAMNLLFLTFMVPLSFSIFFTLKSALMDSRTEELENTTTLLHSEVELFINNTVKIHLRTISEKTRDICIYYYTQYKNGQITEREAYDAAARFILDPNYGKIGKTGYLAAVSSTGILEIHPASQGVDASGFEFIQKAISMKNGYIEYMWANKGEDVERKKAGYMSFFEPWNYMVWASSYSSEFLELLDINDLKGTLDSLTIGEAGYPMILKSNGDTVYHPDNAAANLLRGEKGAALNPELELIMNESKADPARVFSSVYEDGETGEMRIGAVRYLDTMDWFIISSLPVKEVYGVLYIIRNILIIGCTITFFLMNGLILLVFSRMLAPLTEVSHIMGRFAEGDLSQKIQVKSQDEIGSIGEEMNTVIGTFADFFCHMQKDVAVLDSSIQDLTSSSSEISTTSNEQASAVKEIVSTMEDSDALSKSVAQRIDEVAQISAHSREIVNEGVSNVEQSLIKMNEIKISNDDTIKGIRALGEKIEAIWDIVNIINSIADQTKIIAFNAELEASAAGEAGKNFQIVASEIRRLANSTVSSTTEIKTKINEIQHSSDRLITASEDGTNKIEEGGRLSETLHSTFEEILKTTEVSADSAGEISKSIQQQVLAFDQILQTLKQISEGINNFVLSTKSTTEISQKLRDIGSGMSKFLDVFKIEEAVDRDQDPAT